MKPFYWDHNCLAIERRKIKDDLRVVHIREESYRMKNEASLIENGRRHGYLVPEAPAPPTPESGRLAASVSSAVRCTAAVSILVAGEPGPLEIWPSQLAALCACQDSAKYGWSHSKDGRTS